MVGRSGTAGEPSGVMSVAWALDGALPPVVDIECFAPFGTADQAVVRRELRAFSDTVFATIGRLPMIYTSGHMWEEVTGDDPRFGDHPLWVACWRCPEPYLPPGWDDWLVWQIGSMAVRGRSTRLDGNIVRDRVALRRAAAVAWAGAPDRARRRGIRLPLSLDPGTLVRLRVDARAWSAWSPAAEMRSVRLPDQDGRHRVAVQRRSSTGVVGPVHEREVILDRRPPAVVVSLDRMSRLIVVTAEDAGSGIATLRATLDCGHGHEDAGDGTRVARGRVELELPVGMACRVDVQARDRAGNAVRTDTGPWTLLPATHRGHRAS